MTMIPISIQLDKTRPEPLYLQLASHLSTLIQNHELEPGSALPSIRKLATYLSINNVTVVSAYKHLESLGLVSAKKGSGYYIKKRNMITPSSHVISQPIKQMTSQHLHLSDNQINFATATPDASIFPITAFKHYLNCVLDRDQGFAFGYHESNGYEPLRESLAAYLWRHQKLKVSPNVIQIVSGAQQGIDILGKALLNNGDCVLVENPTYTGAIAVFKSRDVLIKGISLELDGLNISELETTLLHHQPKLLYIMTRYQNPSTISYSEAKMKRLIELAELYNFYIVEDDSMSELCYESDAQPLSLKRLDYTDRVIYIKSFSKLMMPGLRIGFIIVPQRLAMDVMNAKHHTDISSSGLIQRTVDLYLREGQWDEHINQMRMIYKQKYNLMLRQLEELKKLKVSYHIPGGGLHFWLKLPSGILATDLYEECLKQSLMIVPGTLFNPEEDQYLNQYIRLSFAACTEDEIVRGTSILKQTLSSILNLSNPSTYISPFI